MTMAVKKSDKVLDFVSASVTQQLPPVLILHSVIVAYLVLNLLVAELLKRRKMITAGCNI